MRGIQGYFILTSTAKKTPHVLLLFTVRCCKKTFGGGYVKFPGWEGVTDTQFHHMSIPRG